MELLRSLRGIFGRNDEMIAPAGSGSLSGASQLITIEFPDEDVELIGNGFRTAGDLIACGKPCLNLRPDAQTP